MMINQLITVIDGLAKVSTQSFQVLQILLDEECVQYTATETTIEIQPSTKFTTTPSTTYSTTPLTNHYTTPSKHPFSTLSRSPSTDTVTK